MCYSETVVFGTCICVSLVFLWYFAAFNLDPAMLTAGVWWSRVCHRHVASVWVAALDAMN